MKRSARGVMAVIGAALVAAAAAPVAGAASISAAKSPGWRLFKNFGCASGAVYGLTSTGPDGVWATGYFTPCVPNATSRVLVARWDGRSWQEPPLPADAAAAYEGITTAALSTSYAWTFGRGEFGDFAWLYRSGEWRTFKLPDRPYVNSAVVFSRSNAWVFGGASTGAPQYAARFNGRTWRRVGIPVAEIAMAAPAPRSIWALGTAVGASEANADVAHWTGSRWTVIPLPPPPTGEQFFGNWINWDTDHGAWVIASVRPGRAVLLLHWTGSRWIKVPYPYTTFGLGPFAHDGRGGFWIASQSCGSCIYTDMVHYSPSGGWSKPVPIGPVAIEAMRLIPGTASVLAAAIRYPGLHNFAGSAVILKYGP
jgi:hypothetical protein